jgi:hypothetical protein
MTTENPTPSRQRVLESGTADRPKASAETKRISGPFAFACSWRDDADLAIGAERPEALAFIAFEFFERRGLFPVSRESGIGFS